MKQRPLTLLINWGQEENIRPFSPKAERTLQVYPALGLGYLAAYLKSRDFPVKILDAAALGLDDDGLSAAIGNSGAGVVGITATTVGWHRAARAAEIARKALPGAFLVAGGPQLTLFPGESLKASVFDGAVIGDGEETLLEIVDRLSRGDDVLSVEGAAFRQGNEIRVNPPRPWIEDLSALPHPDVSELPRDRYRCLTVKQPFYTMITSRGCPYHCGFCSQACCGDRVRFRSPADVVGEMEFYVNKMGARELVIFDETFTLDRDRVMEICQRITRADLDFRWNVRTRVDTVDQAILTSMKNAGCHSLHMGVESGSPRILKLMNKGITLKQVQDAFAAARRLGFVTRGYFMIGYLDEDRETYRQTLELALKLPLDWASFSITVPLPGTDLFRRAVERGLVARDHWLRHTRLEPVEMPYIKSPHWSRQQIEEMLREAFKRFYLRPSYALGRLSRPGTLPGIGDILGGLGLLGSIGK